MGELGVAGVGALEAAAANLHTGGPGYMVAFHRIGADVEFGSRLDD